MAPFNYREYNGVKIIHDCLYDFCTCKPGKDPDVVLLFIHGIALNQVDPNELTSKTDTPFKTWTFEDPDSKDCWPSKLLKDDERLKNKNVMSLAVAYDASKFTTPDRGRLDLYLLAGNFNNMIVPELVRRARNKPIILVAHSFGGFLIQELVEHAYTNARRSPQSPQREFLQNLEGIFFYATPFGALRDDAYFSLFPTNNDTPYSELVDLLQQLNARLARNQSHYLLNLPAIEREYRNELPIKVRATFEANATTIETARGRYWTGTIAVEAAAQNLAPGETTQSVALHCDHFTICRPSTVDSHADSRYFLLVRLIEDVLESNYAKNSTRVR